MPPTFKPDIQRILLENITMTSKKYIYGTITLYGSKIPNRIRFIQKSLKVSLHTTSPTIHKGDSVCSVSVSLAVTNDIAYCFLFLHLLRCFNSVGSQSYTDQHENMLGSPIRQSWVPKMYAPRPSLSQLTTTFIGNSSQAIPQIAQVAKF